MLLLLRCACATFLYFCVPPSITYLQQVIVCFKIKRNPNLNLSHQGRGGGGLILPVRLELAGSAVVSSQAVDTGLHKNESEFAILVLPEDAKMLSNGHSLLHELVQVLGDGRGQAVLLEDAQDLAAGHRLDLSDALAITKDDTNLGRGKTLLGELANAVLNIGGGLLHPRSRGALVGDGTLRDTLSRCVHASHL